MLGLNEACVIAVTVITTVSATCCVVIRLFQAKKISQAIKPGWMPTVLCGYHFDDILVFIALVLYYPMSVIIMWGAVKGAVGSHSSPSDMEGWITAVTPQWITLAKVVWVALWLQPLVLGCVKLSILFFCRRIFSVYRSFKIVSMIMICLVTAFTICFFFGLFFDCGTNISANWGSLAEIGEQCPFGFLPTVIYTIIDAGFDLIILVLPLPWIFKLQMPLSKQLAVAGCFLLGGLATAAAIVRMAIFIETGVPSAALNRQEVMGLPVYDVVGIVSAEMFWHMLESAVAIIAVCLPATRKVVTWVTFNRIFGISAIGRYYASMRSSGTRSRQGRTEMISGDSKLISHNDFQAELHNKESKSRLGMYGDEEYGRYKSNIPMGSVEELTTHTVAAHTCNNCGAKQMPT